MNVSCACVPCAYSHERACTSTYRVRGGGRRVCAFTSVRGIDVSCACAVTSLVRAQPSCGAFTSVRVQPSCVRVHERARVAVLCARSRACVRVDVSCACARRVRVVTSVMDLRSISGR